MKYVIDVSTWRCGSFGRNKHGLGRTKLLNKEGYSCCVGQMCMQKGIPKEDLLHRAFAQSVIADNIAYSDILTPDLTFYTSVMIVNDVNMLTLQERMDGLKVLAAQNGHELEFINL